ncbi:MAG: peroxidase family protein [Tabrizicola sp.]
MLYSTGHGGQIVPASMTPGLAESAAVFDGPLAAPVLVPSTRAIAVSRSAARSAGMDRAIGGAFRYLFPTAPAFPASGTTLAALDALGNSMFDPANPSPPVSIPPILTYFGQFIDHDITANTDRKVAGVSDIEGNFVPTSRADVMAGVDNLRDGSLGLDSLYGDSVGQDAFSAKLAGLMRHPTLTKKMRLGVPAPTPQGPITPPADTATDLLRLGFLLDRGDLTVAELNALPPDQRAAFIDSSNNPIRQRAILGDFRNDENLLIAQLQVAFLRFHNKLADLVPTFDEARKLTRYHYQWLVAHEYLPSLCDRSVVDELIATGSPLYGAFFDANVPAMAPKMPMPLEFSAACFRFGHTMVRGGYDHNRVFGRPEPGKPNILPFAAFNLLFAFTGDGRMSGQSDTQLPDNWVIDWSRFVNAETPVRSAKGLDTRLDAPLDNMVNQPAGIFKNLAKRNLRRGFRLNLPSAQACIAGINASGHFRPITALDAATIMDGRNIAGADFGQNTPLWFYILREAELLGSSHLGPLGTHIVAGTLLGLIIKDQSSYWNDTSAGHRWSPSTFRPGAPIDSLKAMLRFTGQLAF